MSGHLSDVLTAFTEEAGRASAATAPDPSHEAQLLGRRIARRRAVRTGVVSVTSAAAVLGAAVGVSALVDEDAPHPPATELPSPSVTPTPTPTPSATPEFLLPPVTVHPLLPDAEAMPPGTFARTGDGWVLVQRSLVEGNGEGDGLIERSYFYLVDPTGTRYEVPFDTDRSVNLVDWLPGTSTALVQLGGLGDWSSGIAVMDLETGTFRDLPDGVYGEPVLMNDGTVIVSAWDEGEVATYDADGAEVASVRFDGLFVSTTDLDTSRTRLAVTTDGGVYLLSTELEALDAPGATAFLDDQACVSATWLDEGTLNAKCPVDGQPGEFGYWAVPLDGEPEALPIDTTPAWRDVAAVRAGGRTYVYQPAVIDPDTNQEVTPAQLSLIAGDGTLVPVEPTLGWPAATGSRLVGRIELVDGRAGDLVAIDTVTGTAVVVMPTLAEADRSPETKQVAYTRWATGG
jgi:hypothetical protein